MIFFSISTQVRKYQSNIVRKCINIIHGHGLNNPLTYLNEKKPSRKGLINTVNLYNYST